MGGSTEIVGTTAVSSPWPLLVALGLVLSELGIFVGSIPLSVGGLVLFGGALTGLVHEVGYGASIGRSVALVGGLLALVGVGLWLYGATAVSVPALLAAPGNDAIARRGVAGVVAGALLAVFGGVGGWLSTRAR